MEVRILPLRQQQNKHMSLVQAVQDLEIELQQYQYHVQDLENQLENTERRERELEDRLETAYDVNCKLNSRLDECHDLDDRVLAGEAVLEKQEATILKQSQTINELTRIIETFHGTSDEGCETDVETGETGEKTERSAVCFQLGSFGSLLIQGEWGDAGYPSCLLWSVPHECGAWSV